MNLSEKLYASAQNRVRDMVAQPDWYKDFSRFRQVRLIGAAGVQAAIAGRADKAKERLYDTFEQLLSEDAVNLGMATDRGLENWDAERRATVGKVVIHHTSRPPGLSLERLNAIHLLRLYVPRYQSKEAPVVDAQGNLQPIYSGHFDENGKPVFYGYHWLVRKDGTEERLLPDEAAGWHAGDWDVNCESVGICVDDDLESKRPNEAVIAGIAGIIRRYYGAIAPDDDTIIGHNEVIGTACPGREFLGPDGWKRVLLDQLESS